ncbi:MAG: M20/M25/M40 family metallo-hydrolase [Streptosporangiaceae bacterium]|nr:M20/M25/M40 family metallo-hydrolase [Streptosporangiaceae bacterium]
MDARDAPGNDTTDPALADRVRGLMPQLTAELVSLVAIPSVSEHGFPATSRPALLRARDAVAALFRDAGCERVGSLELPDTAPMVTAEIPAPEGAPTVLLYSHYDVVPPGDLSQWHSPPFEPSERDGAIFGRGTADTKSNIMAHVGALRAWDGHPPVGVKVVIEGMEEVGGGAVTTYPPQHPEMFDANVMIIGDMGNVRPGVPTLTVALRGTANVTVEVRTLASAKHSGLYGGAAPDALLALLRALSTLHDERGDVAVEGLRREEWTGAGNTEEEFRGLAEVEDGQPLIGTGNLGSRVWSGPAITVIGIDVPSVDDAVNAVSPYARAKLNLRVHPEQDAADAQAALMRHLASQMPFGIRLEVHPGATGNGFAARTSSAAYDAARGAWSAAWGGQTVTIGAGGSIPLVSALHEAVPAADILLTGATDGYANIHGPNERVLLDEFEKATLAEADLLGRLAAGYGGGHR